jgi:uncharacterized coiled-coil DUF342 family protein
MATSKRIKYSTMMPDDNSSLKPSIAIAIDGMICEQKNILEDGSEAHSSEYGSGAHSSEESVKDDNNGAYNSELVELRTEMAARTIEMIDCKSELAEVRAELALMKATLLEKDQKIKEIFDELKEIRLSLALQRRVSELAEMRAAERAHQNRAAERAEIRAEAPIDDELKANVAEILSIMKSVDVTELLRFVRGIVFG